MSDWQSIESDKIDIPKSLDTDAKQQIYERLETLPEVIYGKENHVLALNNKINQLDDNLEAKKMIHQRTIANAKDEDGKKKYSNKQSREAELTTRLNNDTDYQILKEEKDDLYDKLEQAKNDIKHAKRVLKATRYQVLLITGGTPGR